MKIEKEELQQLPKANANGERRVAAGVEQVKGKTQKKQEEQVNLKPLAADTSSEVVQVGGTPWTTSVL